MIISVFNVFSLGSSVDGVFTERQQNGKQFSNLFYLRFVQFFFPCDVFNLIFFLFIIYAFNILLLRWYEKKR